MIPSSSLQSISPAIRSRRAPPLPPPTSASARLAASSPAASRTPVPSSPPVNHGSSHFCRGLSDAPTRRIKEPSDDRSAKKPLADLRGCSDEHDLGRRTVRPAPGGFRHLAPVGVEVIGSSENRKARRPGGPWGGAEEGGCGCSGLGQQNGPLHGAAGQSNREVQAAWRRLPAVSAGRGFAMPVEECPATVLSVYHRRSMAQDDLPHRPACRGDARSVLVASIRSRRCAPMTSPLRRDHRHRGPGCPTTRASIAVSFLP